jgi:hypothetical protein
MCQATRLLETLQSIANRPVIDERYVPVASYLRSRRYGSLAIDQTLRCIEQGVEMDAMWWMDAEDRAVVGGMLADIDEPEDCHPACPVCREESAFRRGLLRPSGRAEKRPDDSDLTTEHAF